MSASAPPAAPEEVEGRKPAVLWRGASPARISKELFLDPECLRFLILHKRRSQTVGSYCLGKRRGAARPAEVPPGRRPGSRHVPGKERQWIMSRPRNGQGGPPVHRRPRVGTPRAESRRDRPGARCAPPRTRLAAGRPLPRSPVSPSAGAAPGRGRTTSPSASSRKTQGVARPATWLVPDATRPRASGVRGRRNSTGLRLCWSP